MGAEKDRECPSDLVNHPESADRELDAARVADDIAAIDAAAGAWADRDFDGEQYVEAIRPGNDEGAEPR